MSNLEKINEMNGNVIRDDFFILDHEVGELYIDTRTKKFNEQMKRLPVPIVTPIAFSSFFFWYICPNCQTVHIGSNSQLNVDNKILRLPCTKGFDVEIQLNSLKSDQIDYLAFEAVWETMKEFEE